MSTRKNFHFHRHLCRERPCVAVTYTEEQIQEFIDDYILKLRVARHLRTTEYNELFGGDPMWITEGLGGVGADGTSQSYKEHLTEYSNTLYNLGPAPEPNLTVLWSESTSLSRSRDSVHRSQ